MKKLSIILGTIFLVVITAMLISCQSKGVKNSESNPYQATMDSLDRVKIKYQATMDSLDRVKIKRDSILQLKLDSLDKVCLAKKVIFNQKIAESDRKIAKLERKIAEYTRKIDSLEKIP